MSRIDELLAQWRDWFRKNADPRLDGFLGPCFHGRDPYTRCEICVELTPEQAKILAEQKDAV